MRKRSASLAIIALLLLGLGGGVWITSLDDSDQATSTGEPEPPVVERPAPTLVATAQEVEAMPLPAPAQPKTVEKPALRVRVVSEDEPVGGAVVSIDYLSEDDMVAVTAPCTTDMDGRCVLPVDASTFPLAIVVRGSANMIPVALTLDAVPEDEVVVSLRVGRSLEVHTIDMDRNPMPGVPLVLFSVGLWARGNTGMTQAPSGWVLEDSRRVTTDADGVAVVHGLDPDRFYRAYAPGYGIPAQIVPAPKIPQPDHHAVAPGSGKTLVLMLAPLRIVWARAVDAETGEPVSMSWIRPFFAPDRRPKEQDVLMRALHLQDACGVLGLSESIRSGDYFRMRVMGQPGSDTIATGPFKVDAPGYETTEVLLQARALDDLAKKPMEVRLDRKPGAVFAPLTISLRTNRPRVHAIVQLRRGRRNVLHRGFASESHNQDIEAKVALGTYELFVGGTSMGKIEVRGPEPIRRIVNLDTLASLQISLSVGGAVYTGIGSVAMTGPSPTRWMFIHARIPYRDGLSPHVIVPAGQLTVAAGTGDGRFSGNGPPSIGGDPGYEHPTIAPGEKAVVSVSVK